MSTPQTFLNGRVALYAGDCREIVASLPDASIDSCVSDPPYALVSISKRFGKPGSAPAVHGKDGLYARASAGFMGKAWDTGDVAFDPTFWADVLRVLKPGAHLVAFGGTRSYHRLACAIEDAGFEIRDQIAWNYGSGFPKSHNIVKKLQESGKACTCPKTMVSRHHVSDKNLRDLQRGMDALDSLSGGSQSDVQQGVHNGGIAPESATSRASRLSVNSVCDVRDACSSPAVTCGSECRDLLQPVVQVQELRVSSSGNVRKHEGAESEASVWGVEPSLEGRSDDQAAARQLQGRQVRAGSGMGSPDGSEGRLHHGTSSHDGSHVRVPPSTDRSGASSRPHPLKQPSEQSGALAFECRPQAWGGWPVCPGCHKPIVPEGYGTALKPAWEPIVLARKPLVGTVAANVLEHGTGAINIDGCRVGTEGGTRATNFAKKEDGRLERWDEGYRGARNEIENIDSGRWPANIVHDGSDEVVGAFPLQSSGGAPLQRHADKFRNTFGAFKGAAVENGIGGSSGSAARFFYSAKADADDRLGSKHPTVEPVDLMQWLCRLVTPPGGTVLDAFAGTGATGEAAWREGFSAVLIERESEYRADIARRMELAQAGPATRTAERVKARFGDVHAGPLFGSAAE